MRLSMKLFTALLLSLFLVACGETIDRTGQAQAPGKSSKYEGDHFEEVVAAFEEAGFTNIQLEKIDDLIFGWLKSDGDVKQVTIDGEDDYSTSTWYSDDVDVIIAYHTFPEKDVANNANNDGNDVNDSNENEINEEEIPDNDEGDVISQVYEDAVGKSAADIYQSLMEDGHEVEFVHAVTKMDFTGEVIATIEGYYDEPLEWVITGIHEANADKQFVVFAINTGENMDRIQAEEDTKEILSAKLSPSVAWGTASLYGEREFPGGFKLNMVKGMLAETAIDEDTWFLKSYCEVMNEYGQWIEYLTCEITVTGTNDSPQVVEFMIYE